MRNKILIILVLYIPFMTGRVLSQPSDVSRDDFNTLFENNTLIGVLGTDYSRIDIHFMNARKVSDSMYEINGASRTRLQIVCRFKGEISIDSIVHMPSLESEVEDIDGYIFGKYRFIEDEKQMYSGRFSGIFKQAFRVNEQGVEEAINLIPENKINLSEYVGIWQSNEGTSKVCNWADAIIPAIPSDFCVYNDAGEWIVSPKYRKRGWDNMYNAYFNDDLSEDNVKSAQYKEEERWWDHLNTE